MTNFSLLSGLTALTQSPLSAPFHSDSLIQFHTIWLLLYLILIKETGVLPVQALSPMRGNQLTAITSHLLSVRPLARAPCPLGTSHASAGSEHSQQFSWHSSRYLALIKDQCGRILMPMVRLGVCAEQIDPKLPLKELLLLRARVPEQ